MPGMLLQIRPLLKLLGDVNLRSDVVDTLYTVVANFTPDSMIIGHVIEVRMSVLAWFSSLILKGENLHY